MNRWSNLLPRLSDGYILDSYEELRRVAKENPEEIQEHPDFGDWGHALEAEMDRRGLAYERVKIRG